MSSASSDSEDGSGSYSGEESYAGEESSGESSDGASASMDEDEDEASAHAAVAPAEESGESEESDEDDEDDDESESEESGQSIAAAGADPMRREVPDLGGDEDDDEPRKQGGGFLSYLGFGATGAAAAAAAAEPTDADIFGDDGSLGDAGEEEYKYDFAGEAPLQDEAYDDLDPEGDAEAALEAELKDDQLEKRLELAYAFATRDAHGEMRIAQFRQAVAMMGKVFTKEETDNFFDEAVTHEHVPRGDPKALGASQERDDRGLLKREPCPGARHRHGDVLTLKYWLSFFEKYMTRTVDPAEALEHFRALVEGAAEMALRGGGEGGDASSAAANEELHRMRTTKHLPVAEIFIYAKDLRKVMVAYSEKLTDEEADAFVRECKPRPEPGAHDGGLDRVYFSQYLTMLKEDV